MNTPAQILSAVMLACCLTTPAAAIDDAHARPEFTPSPLYPDVAVDLNLEGVVWLAVTVSESGAVSALRIKDSSAHRVLESAALRAVRDWRFHPARSGSVAVASVVEVPVRFALSRQQ